MKNIILSLFLSIITISGFAQQKYTLSGTIKDQATGELMIGATVKIQNSTLAVSSNEYGFYSLLLPQGKHTVVVSYTGYNAVTLNIDIKANLKKDWELSTGQNLNEVVIASVRKDQNLSSPAMGTETLNIKAIEKLPVLFGEKDVLKTIQLLPGIKSTGEGSSGFSVRGGAADQNLILLDEAPVYNASHLLGFFSTFNSDALKDASIIKGNSPAQYGGRLSSVMDVKMKDGNNQSYHVNGGIGVISSRLSVEGPIQKDRSSFIVSGRRTYADLFLKLSEDFKDSKLYFYDLNAKANYQINESNRIYVSGYFGRDVLGFGDTFGTDWGNTTQHQDGFAVYPSPAKTEYFYRNGKRHL